MARKIGMLSSLVVFVVGVGLFLYLSFATWQLTQLDKYEGLAGGGGPIKDCDFVSFDVPRLMTDKESQVLNITFINRNFPGVPKQECETYVYLATTDFNFSPAIPDTTPRLITIPANQQTITVSWIISPKSVGTYHILMRTFSFKKTITISVGNVLGWNAWQIQLYSVILAVLGIVGGIGTTFGWFGKAYNMLYRKRDANKKSESIKSSPAQSKSVRVTSTKTPSVQQSSRKTRQK